MGRAKSLRELIKVKDKDKVKDIKEIPKRYIFNSLSLSNTSNAKVKQVRSKASYLASRLHNEKDMNFYLKCAWTLDEEFLDNLLAISLTKNYPRNYFAKSAASEMRNLAMTV